MSININETEPQCATCAAILLWLWWCTKMTLIHPDIESLWLAQYWPKVALSGFDYFQYLGLHCHCWWYCYYSVLSEVDTVCERGRGGLAGAAGLDDVWPEDSWVPPALGEQRENENPQTKGATHSTAHLSFFFFALNQWLHLTEGDICGQPRQEGHLWS